MLHSERGRFGHQCKNHHTKLVWEDTDKTRWYIAFQENKEHRNHRSHRFYRVINEIPALILIAVVVLVIVKPF